MCPFLSLSWYSSAFDSLPCTLHIDWTLQPERRLNSSRSRSNCRRGPFSSWTTTAARAIFNLDSQLLSNPNHRFDPWTALNGEKKLIRKKALLFHITWCVVTLTPSTINSCVCMICNKAFNLRGELRQHVKAIHHKIKEHKCQVCDKKFVFVHNLNRHVKDLHEKKMEHACEQCGRMFSRKDNLNRHVKVVHDWKK